MSFFPRDVIPNREPVLGTITALGGSVSAAVEGWSACSIVVTGVWAGTLVFQASSDGGVTWFTGAFVIPPATATPVVSLAVPITVNGSYECIGMGSTTNVRIISSAWTSGTASIRFVFADNLPPILTTMSGVHQNVMASVSNNSHSNLAGGAQFVGTAETTLGVAGIQVNFISDQVCRIQVQQSYTNDPTLYWDISDEFTSIPGVGDGRTFQATNSYFRIVVTNVTGTITTYLRLDVALCPIVEVLPRSLSERGNLKVGIDEAGVLARDYIINAQFSNNYLDEYDWYRTSGSGGAVTPLASYVEVGTSTNSASYAYLNTKQIVYPSVEPVLEFCAVLFFDQPTGLTNNTRRWGMITSGDTDGICFELKDGVLYATVIANSVPTRVSINGFKPTDGNSHHYDLDVSRDWLKWSIDDSVVYEIPGNSLLFPFFYKRSFRPTFNNVNSGAVGSTSYLRLSYCTLCDSVVGAVRLQGEDGNQTNVSIDGYLRQKGYGSILFAELFPDNTLDTTNKWTEAIVTGGSKSLAGTLLSLSVTTANGASITETARQAVLTAAGQSMTRIMMVVNLGLVFDANNRREWGTKTGTNGFFFRQSGTSTYAVALNAGSETTLLLPAITDGRIHVYEIVRTGLTDAWFYIDRQRVGAIHGTSAALVGSKYDTAYLANYNVGVSANPITMVVSAHAVIEDSNQSINIIGTDQYGLKRNVAVDDNGALRITGVGVTTPTSVGAGESLALRAYQFAFERSLAALSTEYPIILIRNPVGSGKKMMISQIICMSLTTDRRVRLRLYQTPTVTANGTAQTPSSMYLGGGAPAASVLVNTAPTVTANGTKITILSSWDHQSEVNFDWGQIVAPNNSLLITGEGSSNNTLMGIVVIWTEAV